MTRDTSTISEDNSASSAISLLESGLVELTDMPVGGLSGETGDTKDYYIDIGPGVSTLVVTLDVSTGDPDLYVGRIFPASADNADCESVLSEGNDEECKINNPVEGRYYISVLAYSSYDGAALKATFPSPPMAPTITNITPANSALEVAFEPGSGSADSYQLSCVDPSLRNATDVLAFVTEPRNRVIFEFCDERHQRKGWWSDVLKCEGLSRIWLVPERGPPMRRHGAPRRSPAAARIGARRGKYSTRRGGLY